MENSNDKSIVQAPAKSANEAAPAKAAPAKAESVKKPAKAAKKPAAKKPTESKKPASVKKPAAKKAAKKPAAAGKAEAKPAGKKPAAKKPAAKKGPSKVEQTRKLFDSQLKLKSVAGDLSKLPRQKMLKVMEDKIGMTEKQAQTYYHNEKRGRVNAS